MIKWQATNLSDGTHHSYTPDLAAGLAWFDAQWDETCFKACEICRPQTETPHPPVRAALRGSVRTL